MREHTHGAGFLAGGGPGVPVLAFGRRPRSGLVTTLIGVRENQPTRPQAPFDPWVCAADSTADTMSTRAEASASSRRCLSRAREHGASLAAGPGPVNVPSLHRRQTRGSSSQT